MDSIFFHPCVFASVLFSVFFPSFDSSVCPCACVYSILLFYLRTAFALILVDLHDDSNASWCCGGNLRIIFSIRQSLIELPLLSVFLPRRSFSSLSSFSSPPTAHLPSAIFTIVHKATRENTQLYCYYRLFEHVTRAMKNEWPSGFLSGKSFQFFSLFSMQKTALNEKNNSKSHVRVRVNTFLIFLTLYPSFSFYLWPDFYVLKNVLLFYISKECSPFVLLLLS